MNKIKRILAISIVGAILPVTSCLAVTLENTVVTKNKTCYYQTYKVQEGEQNNFINNLEKEIEILGNKYAYEDYISTGGVKRESIDISTNKQIISETNDLDNIINQLGRIINYEKDGYTGEYILDTTSIKIKTNDNGFRDKLIEETINYTNLERNDLDFIPKQTKKNGLTLDLLNVEWKVEKTKKIGEYEVADTYMAKCHYACKQRIDYPNTYTVTAKYSGTATKTMESPYIYTVKYKKVEEKQPKSVPNVAKEKDNNLLPIASSTTGIILIILIFFTKNVTVYNYKDGEYVKIGKTRMRRNNIINLTRYSLLETTNKYKLKLSKRLTKKMQCKMLTIAKGSIKVKMLVNTDEDKFVIETVI